MKIAKTIRKNKVINGVIAVSLNKAHLWSNRLFDYLKRRWPTSGLIDCEFNGVSFKLNNHCDDWLVQYFYYGFKYPEEADLRLFMNLAEHSNCILDIGANTGVFSILSSAVSPNSEIYAFEPFSSNANRLKHNVEVNGLNNITIFQEALGDQIGEIELSIPKNNEITDVSSTNLEFSKSVYPEIEWQLVKVRMNTIDNFRKSIDKPIDLIKCDVETFEMSVFNGGLNVLNTDKPTIIFESFLNSERISFFNNILKEYSYYMYLILEQGVVYNREGFGNAHSGLNYLITPVKPSRTFISFTDKNIIKELLL